MPAGAEVEEEPIIYEMYFKHPFLFGIIDRNSALLFIGICTDPTESNNEYQEEGK